MDGDDEGVRKGVMLVGGVLVLAVVLVGGFLYLQSLSSIESARYQTQDSIQILNSNNGYKIAMRVVGPKFSEYPSEKFPVVLRVSGEWGTSSNLLDSPYTL